MAKYSWKYDDQYWQPDDPSPDQRVPSIPPRPMVAEPLLPRKLRPRYMLATLVLAVGFCVWSAMLISLVLR